MILDGTGPGDLRREPFAHLYLDPVLDEDAYTALEQGFPALTAFAPDAAQRNNKVLRLDSSHILQDPDISPAWKAFVADHTGAAFWQAWVRVFGPALRAAHPDIEARAGLPLEKWPSERLGEGRADALVSLECQLVVNTPVREAASSVRGPHLDLPGKLWGGLLYLRHPHDDTPGGNLDLYAAPPDLRFYGAKAPRNSIRLQRTIDYGRNVFTGFVNSPAAVHAVTPRPPTAHVRRYVNFFADLKFGPLFDTPQLRGLGYWTYRLFHNEKGR